MLTLLCHPHLHSECIISCGERLREVASGAPAAASMSGPSKSATVSRLERELKVHNFTLSMAQYIYMSMYMQEVKDENARLKEELSTIK